MRDSVPSASYSSVCNVLRQWNIPLIPTYRVYRLYDINHGFRCIVLIYARRQGQRKFAVYINCKPPMTAVEGRILAQCTVRRTMVHMIRISHFAWGSIIGFPANYGS